MTKGSGGGGAASLWCPDGLSWSGLLRVLVSHGGVGGSCRLRMENTGGDLEIRF